MTLWWILQWAKGETGSGWSFKTITGRSWCCLTLIRTARRCVARGLQCLATSQVCDEGTHTHARMFSLFLHLHCLLQTLCLCPTHRHICLLCEGQWDVVVEVEWTVAGDIILRRSRTAALSKSPNEDLVFFLPGLCVCVCVFTAAQLCLTKEAEHKHWWIHTLCMKTSGDYSKPFLQGCSVSDWGSQCQLNHRNHEQFNCHSTEWHFVLQ